MDNQKNAGKDWSAAKVEKLKRLAAAGLPVNEIAKRLMRTTSAVYAKASKVKVSFNRTKK